MAEALFEALWKQFVAGNKQAFGQLYEAYHRRLLLYCLGFLKDLALAEDAASETLQKLYEYPEVQGLQNFEGWLYTVARNSCLSKLEKEGRRANLRQAYFGSDATAGTVAPEAYQQSQHNDIAQLLKQVLAPQEQQIWQWHQEGYDNAEIAQKMDMNPKTVANTKSLIRQKLRKALGKTGRQSV